MSAGNMMKGWTKPSANCKPLFQMISGAQRPSKHECLMVWISQVSPLFVISVLVPEIEPPVFPWRPTLWLIVHAPARRSLKWIIQSQQSLTPPRNRSFLRERLVPSTKRICFVGKSAVEHLQGDIEEVILSLVITALLFPKGYSNFSESLTHLSHHEVSLPQSPISMQVSNVPPTSW